MHHRSRPARSFVASLAALSLAATIAAVASAGIATAAPPTVGPYVTHTGTGPTGYEVTINFSAPTASQVEVYAEWAFATPNGSAIGTPHGPDAWAPGDVPSGGSWWYSPMSDADGDGIWTFTSPMPPGTYSYTFLADCPSHAASCRRVDPANVPWSNQPAQVAANAAQQTMSQVFIPTDSRFSTRDVSYLEESSGQHGALRELTYESPESTAPAGLHRATVYLPPGYDPDRVLPYPTVYVSHGGSGNETDWVTQGQANVILDNAINGGFLQPVVAVFTDFNGIPNGVDGFRAEVINRTVPAIERNYNVGTEPSARAFAGLSAGSQRTINIIENQPEAFDYYGPWSSGGNPGPAVLTDAVKAGMAGIRSIYSGVGAQDNEPGRERADYLAQRMGSYRDQIPGLEVSEHYVPGVHSWDVWRELLDGFLRDCVFRATDTTASASTSVVAAGVPFELRAAVAQGTPNATAPTGRVRFYA
ncbi:MAG: hypothetical protein LBT54_00680, partial [Bifidobacteriaceae bacterium]|nr:hypothetical protein [Bifidobacteriaceae bacterium]